VTKYHLGWELTVPKMEMVTPEHTWLGSPAITKENVDEFLQNRMTIAATEMDRK
jgi:hypothetical protein